MDWEMEVTMRNCIIRYRAYLVAGVGLSLIALALWQYETLATIGSFVVRWLVQMWELLVRVLEFLWRPLFVLAENVARGLLTRPFGRALSWFFLGFVLRYALHPRVRAQYYAFREQGILIAHKAGAHWRRLPMHLRILLIIGVAVGIAVVNVGLLLLPLGFFVEPLFRSIRNWLAREGAANVSFMKRVSSATYRAVRVLMRSSPTFRQVLGPFRKVRLEMIRHSRRYHFKYRKNNLKYRTMLRDMYFKKGAP